MRLSRTVMGIWRFKDNGDLDLLGLRDVIDQWQSGTFLVHSVER